MSLSDELKKTLDEINKKITEKKELSNDDMICLFFINLFNEEQVESGH